MTLCSTAGSPDGLPRNGSQVQPPGYNMRKPTTFTEFDVRSVTAVSRCISTLQGPRGFCMQVLGWGIVSAVDRPGPTWGICSSHLVVWDGETSLRA